jgi:hypothetical protein
MQTRLTISIYLHQPYQPTTPRVDNPSLRMFMVQVSFLEKIHLLEGRSRGLDYLGHDVELHARSRVSFCGLHELQSQTGILFNNIKADFRGTYPVL